MMGSLPITIDVLARSPVEGSVDGMFDKALIYVRIMVELRWIIHQNWRAKQ
jgi:hypothetical protein